MTPYAFRGGNGPLRRTGAGIKLSLLLGLSLLAFFGGIPGLVLSAVAVALGAVLARLGVGALFSGSAPLFLTTAFIWAAGCVDAGNGFLGLGFSVPGFRAGAVFAAGTVLAYAGGSILFATTTTTELRDALARGEAVFWDVCAGFLRMLPFKAAKAAAGRRRGGKASLLLALALGFIPRVFAVWEAAADARRARCGKEGLRGTAALLPLAAERLIEAAAETARALESRGYAPGTAAPATPRRRA